MRNESRINWRTVVTVTPGENGRVCQSREPKTLWNKKEEKETRDKSQGKREI